MAKCTATQTGSWSGKTTQCILKENHEDEHKDINNHRWINTDKYCGASIPAMMGGYYCKKPPNHSGYHRIKTTQNPHIIEFKVIK